jgi:uncharacterized protein YjbI with pentapeptide repeats
MNRFLLAAFYTAIPFSALGWSESDISALKETQVCQACDLSGADLRWANVYEAELGGAANLVGADLSGSDLRGANLYGANLEDARLTDVNLTGADLRWSSLRGADLSGANLGDAQTEGAVFCQTIMPDSAVNDSNC